MAAPVKYRKESRGIGGLKILCYKGGEGHRGGYRCWDGAVSMIAKTASGFQRSFVVISNAVRKMGAEKGGSGGFFNLLDRNRKSRKKLFSNRRSSSGMIQGKKLDDNMSTSQLRLTDEDEMIGVSSVKGSSDYSCTSSMTDEEGNAIRAPGVVARLMGLDFMPVSGTSGPYSNPLNELQSLRNNHSPRNSTDFYIDDQSNHVTTRAEAYSRKPRELRLQKMPSRPIEKFQTEALPPRLAKSIPITQHKILSPIKNPGFISVKNAARIMEAPAMVLGLEVQTRTQGKSSLLAVPAKVIVQRREGLCMSNRSASLHNSNQECKSDRPLKAQPNNPKNYEQKRAATNASSLLRQNNQKQNCPASKLPSKPSASNQQGRKILYGDASARKNKIVNKLSGSTRISFRKEGLITSDSKEEGLSSKNISRKKRLLEWGSSSERSEASDGNLMGKHEKHVQHTIVVDEQQRWNGDKRRNGADVVSFTFSSPMIRPLPGSQFSTHMAEEEDKHNGHCSDTDCEKNAFDSDSRNLSSLTSDVIEDDSLGFLLEQKLRELTSAVDLPYHGLVRGSIAAMATSSQDSLFAADAHSIAPTELEREPVVSSCKDELDGIFESGFSLASGQMFTTNHQLACNATKHKVWMHALTQEAERMECSSTNEDQKVPDHQFQSPVSILEVPFSNESCSLSEICESSNESKMHDSSIQAQHIVDLNCFEKAPSVEAEMDLCDSASSPSTEITCGVHPPEISRTGCTNACNQELEDLREILSNMKCLFKNIDLCRMDHDGGILDPNLFDKLETSGSLTGQEREERDFRMRRKMLLDCLHECLDLKCSRYFRAGYQMWARGMAVDMKDWTEELYKEISGWRSMGDPTVDELVDRDMSSHQGRWLDFEIEAFETGVEIEMEILNSLMDEVVADFMTEVSW